MQHNGQTILMSRQRQRLDHDPIRCHDVHKLKEEWIMRVTAPIKCTDCGSEKLSINIDKGSIIRGLNYMDYLAVLGCDECSATLWFWNQDEVETILNAAWRNGTIMKGT
jgi:hypothetical protein